MRRAGWWLLALFLVPVLGQAQVTAKPPQFLKDPVYLQAMEAYQAAATLRVRMATDATLARDPASLRRLEALCRTAAQGFSTCADRYPDRVGYFQSLARRAELVARLAAQKRQAIESGDDRSAPQNLSCPPLTRARGDFNDALKRLERDRSLALGRPDQLYRMGMSNVLARAQLVHDTHGVQAVKQELLRFRRYGGLPDEFSSMPELREQQVAYQKERAPADAAYAKEKQAIVARYDQVLQGLLKDFLAGGREDLANLIRAERRRIGADANPPAPDHPRPEPRAGG